MKSTVVNSTEPGETLTTALLYANAGIKIFPCKPNKAPATANGFKDASTNPKQIEKWFSSGGRLIGVPTGEIIAIDVEDSETATQFEAAYLMAGIGALCRQKTPSGGAHFLFKSEGEPIKNTKLARAETGGKDGLLIETRGAGGYICTGGGYQWQRGDLTQLTTLTSEQTEDVLSAARSFDRLPKEKKPSLHGADIAPGDDYNLRGDWQALILSHGWTQAGGTRWRRPGKAQGVSADWIPDANLLHVFTSNGEPLEGGNSYSPFALFTFLEHNGNFSEAAKELARQGYGSRTKTDTARDSLAGAMAAARNDGSEFSESLSNLLAALDGAVITEAALAEREAAERDSKFILRDIALYQQATAIYCKPNGGKTLLSCYLLSEAAKAGELENLDVFYLNADDSFSGANRKVKKMAGTGIRFVIPGQGGFEASDFEGVIVALIEADRAARTVLLLDTLKKFTSLMDKTKAAHFCQSVRRFVQAGGTVIALAHTNKHGDADGKAVFEGTGDVVADFDAAYTIEIDTPKAASLRQITFHNFKSRGPNALKVSFRYDAGEGLTWPERFDSVERVDAEAARRAIELAKADEQLASDCQIVDYLKGRLAAGPVSRTSLCQENLGPDGTGSRQQRERILDRYDVSNSFEDFRFWTFTRNDKGGKNYELA